MLTTFVQVAGRSTVLWIVIEAYPSAALAPPYALMVLAWSAADVVRYLYFATRLVGGHQYRRLVWLRYSAFYVLYPIGIASEVGVVSRAVSEAWGLGNMGHAWGYLAAATLYVPGKCYTRNCCKRHQRDRESDCLQPPRLCSIICAGKGGKYSLLGGSRMQQVNSVATGLGLLMSYISSLLSLERLQHLRPRFAVRVQERRLANTNSPVSKPLAFVVKRRTMEDASVVPDRYARQRVSKGESTHIRHEQSREKEEKNISSAAGRVRNSPISFWFLHLNRTCRSWFSRIRS